MDGLARALRTTATALLAVGFAGLALAMWSLAVTVDDGGGADIGGGILALFALMVGTLGLVALAVAGVVAVTARRRGRSAVAGAGR